jgi:hypothetical protein
MANSYQIGVPVLELESYMQRVVDAAKDEAGLVLVDKPSKGNDQAWSVGCNTARGKVRVTGYSTTGTVVFQGLSPIKIKLVTRSQVIKSW